MKKNIFRMAAGFALAVMILVSGLWLGGIKAKAASGYIVSAYVASNENGSILENWGRPYNLRFMSGWHIDSAGHLSLYLVDGQVSYCIEPGVSFGEGRNTDGIKRDDYWENYPDSLNETIDAETVKFFIAQILGNGYNGSVSYETRTDANTGENYCFVYRIDMDTLCRIYATQILIWEVVVGERDASFNHVTPPAGIDAVTGVINWDSGYGNTIMSYYNSYEAAVKASLVNPARPSFMSKTESGADTVEMIKSGSQWTVSLPDSNGVLGTYSFSSDNAAVKASVQGNTLTLTASSAVTLPVMITASRTVTTPSYVVWADSSSSYGQPPQSVVNWSGTQVTDTLMAYLKAYAEEDPVFSGISVKKEARGEVPEGASLKGIRFAIIQGDTVKEVITTDAQGNAKTAKANYPVGTYKVAEMRMDADSVKAGAKWSAVDKGSSPNANADFLWASNEFDVTITDTDPGDGSYKLAGTAYNQAEPKFTAAKVKKVDEKGSPIQGVVFNLVYDGADHKATTDANGIAGWADIPLGTSARLIEVFVPDNQYEIDPAYAAPGKAVSITSGANETFDLGTIENTSLISTALKKVDEKGSPIAGVKFNLHYDGVDHEKETGADGTILWTGIKSGTKATLTETFVPSPYQISEEYGKGKAVTITGKAGSTYDLGSIVNKEESRPVQVQKSSDGNALAGFKFTLKGKSELGESLSLEATTNDKGIASFGEVPCGSYEVKETGVPSHMSVSPEKQSVIITRESENPVVVSFHNSLKQADLRVKKSMASVSNAQKNNVSLKGFTFRLSGTAASGEAINLTATTDANGEAVFKGVPYGEGYSLKEELSSEQKKLWKELDTQSVTISSETVGDAGFLLKEFKNEPAKGSLIIQKLLPENATSDGSGFSFMVSGTSEAGYIFSTTVTTEKGGVVTITDIPVGTYSVEEQLTSEQAKIWEGKDKESVTITKEGEQISFSLANTPKTAKVELVKTSEDGKVKGFSFVLSGTRAIGGSFELIGTTDEKGYISFGEVPYGDYTVTEKLTEAQKAIYKDPEISPKSFTLSDANQDKSVSVTAKNSLKRGGVSIEKADIHTGTTPQGDATLKGIRFAIISQFDTIHKSGISIAGGQVIEVITTNAAGHAETGKGDLPMGEYKLVELRMDAVAEIGKSLQEGSSLYANDSYLWANNELSFSISATDTITPASEKVVTNKPAEPKNPELKKYDLDMGTSRSQGGASFEGIRFALVNRSKNAVYVEDLDKLFAKGQVIDVLTSDKDGVIGLSYTLPYGTYGLMELPNTSQVQQGDMMDEADEMHKFGVSADRMAQLYANASYLYTDREEKQFRAVTDEEGNISYDTSLIHFDNKVARGGIYFEKKLEAPQKHLPYILFRMTLLETGEQHYIFLNPNAYYGTDQLYNLHSNNTNGLDELVAPYADAEIIPQSLIDELILKEAWNWGTWFGSAPVNDSEYALPFGTYRLEELRCEANKNFIMLEDEATIWYSCQYHSFGTIFNKEIALVTQAEDARSHTHEGIARKSATIWDTVFYNNLTPGSEYELIATLWVKLGENWQPIPGVEVHKRFTAQLADHFEVMEISFDASSFENCPVVVFEELRDASGKFLAEHKDLTDPKQTVLYKPAPVAGLSILKEEVSAPMNGIAYMKGEAVKYKITVTNTGEADLEDVEVMDRLTGMEELIPVLKTGKSRSFITSYVVTEEDIRAGKVLNVATANAEDPSSTPEDPRDPLNPEDGEEVPTMEFKPGYEQAKVEVSSPKNGVAYVEGETVTFKLSLKNTGNQPLSVTVKDELVGLYEVVELPVEGSWEKEVSYVVTAEDVAIGHVLNVLSSQAVPPAYPPSEPPVPITPPDVPVDVPTIIPNPKLWIDKAVTDSDHILAESSAISLDGEVTRKVVLTPFRAGETVRYSILVGNSGNMDLYDVQVVDEQTGFEAIIDLLKVGEVKEFFTEYTISEEDAEKGEFINIALATALDPNEPNDPEHPTLPPVEDEEKVPAFVAEPSLLSSKEAVSKPQNGVAYVEGETVTYRLTVTNNGNVDLVDVLILDEQAGFELTLPELKVGEVWTKDIEYVITKEDVAAGSVKNVLTVTGTDPKDPEKPVTPPPAEEEVPTMDPQPHVSIKKETVSEPANGKAYVEGEVITYQITVVNDGNMDLYDIVVEDEMLGFKTYIPRLNSGHAGEASIPAGVEVFTLTYTVTKEDVEAGKVLNVATVTAPNPNKLGDPENPDLTDEDEQENPTTKIGTVTVIYLDEDGKVLIEKEVVLEDVPEGTEYVTLEREIEGYQFKELHTDSAPVAGKVKEGISEVIYVYERIPEPVPEPEPTPEPTPEPGPEPAPEPDSPKGEPSPVMGDGSNMALPIFAILFSSASLVLILIWDKKGKGDKNRYGT